MIKKIFIFISLYVMILSSNCMAGFIDPDIDFKPPAYVQDMPDKHGDDDHVYQGSIFGKNDNSLFSDHKAMRVNDIVTIVISETTKSSNTGTKALSNSDSSNLGGGLFTADKGANHVVSEFAKQLDGLTDVKYASASTSAYAGKGNSAQNASFGTTVTARIIKVLDNGNYFIAGMREILIDNQNQIIQVSGVIRPYDVNQNNRINSSQISDAKILYTTEGDIDRATKQRWGTKIIQSSWPF